MERDSTMVDIRLTSERSRGKSWIGRCEGGYPIWRNLRLIMAAILATLTYHANAGEEGRERVTDSIWFKAVFAEASMILSSKEPSIGMLSSLYVTGVSLGSSGQDAPKGGARWIVAGTAIAIFNYNRNLDKKRLDIDQTYEREAFRRNMVAWHVLAASWVIGDYLAGDSRTSDDRKTPIRLSLNAGGGGAVTYSRDF